MKIIPLLGQRDDQIGFC